MQRILKLEKGKRNSVLLRVLYASGLRVSEICGLTWADCQPRRDGCGQIAVFGKGNTTRWALLPKPVWARLETLRTPASKPKSPVFRSRQGGALTRMQVLNIVRAAALRAGITEPVSPVWFRHAHASHSLDRGAPISLVQATLGHSSLATTGRYLHARPDKSSADFLAY